MTTGPVFCRNCGLAIRPDGRGGWVHYFHNGHGDGYTCRNRAGVLMPTSAAPDLPPGPPEQPEESNQPEQPSRPPDWPTVNPYRRTW